MKQGVKRSKNYAGWATSLLAAIIFAFSPILFPAFAANFSKDSVAKGKITAAALLSQFTPASIDSKLAAKFQRDENGLGAIKIARNRFAFTPAGVGVEGARTMTIAARANSPLSSQAVNTRAAFRISDVGNGSPIGLVKSDFRLTAAKGWKGFSAPVVQNLAVRAPAAALNIAAGNFRLDEKASAKKSRFDADVRVDQNRSAVPIAGTGKAPGDYQVDLEGSFSLSKRIAVTAGVRYQNEQDRARPKVEDRNDSEAVYVGTKIRF